MIIIRYFNILCFLFLIISCDSNKKPCILPSNISIDSNQVLSNDLFDLIKDIQILKLKYENGSPYFIYTRPKKILIFKNKFYVKPNNFEILQFDISGVFLGKISLAESPIVNHKEITDFIIDRESNIIILHDFQKQRLSFYSLDLDYLYSENVGYNFTAFEKRNNYFYFFTSKHRNKIDKKFYDYDIIVTDTNFNVTNTHLPFDHKQFSLIRIKKMNPFYTANDNLYFNDVVSDTVYNLSDNSLDVSFNYTYNKSLPSNLLKGSHQNLLDYVQNDNNDVDGIDFLANIKCMSNEYIISSHNNGLKRNYVITDKLFNNLLKYESGVDGNNLGMIFECQSVDSNSNKFVTSLKSESVIDLLRTSKLNLDKDSSNNIYITDLHNVEKDNYFIVFFKISNDTLIQ